MSRNFLLIRFFSIFVVLLLGAACTSSGNQVNNALASSGSTANPANAENQTALAAEPTPSPAANVTEQQTAQQTQQVASLDTAKAISFLPVEGAPQGKVSELSASLQKSTASHGLTMLPASNPGNSYQVKGYFSALNDGTGTLLVYIWDVQDKSGNRLHRINGQERSGAVRSNPWQAITETELAKVADNTAAQLKSWLETRK